MNNDNSIKKLNEIRKQLLGFISAAEQAKPLIRFISALCTIDAAANYWFGRPSVRCSSVVFKSFIELCLPKYSTFSKQIYNSFRCKLVHALTLGDDIALVAGNREADLKYWDKEHMISVEDAAGKKMPVIINLENFVESIKETIDNLFDDAANQSIPVNAPTIKMDEHDENYKVFYKDSSPRTIFITKSQYEEFTAITKLSDGEEKLSHLWKLRDVYPELSAKVDLKGVLEKRGAITLQQNILEASEQIELLQIHELHTCKNVCGENHITTPNYGVFQSDNSLTCN